LHNLEINVMLVSSVGNDENGKGIVAFLKSKQFDLGYIQVADNFPTGIVNVKLDENKNAKYDILQPVAWDYIEYPEQLDNESGVVNALVYGTLACRNEVSRASLLKLMSRTSLNVFDMNLRSFNIPLEILETLLSYASVLKINEDEFDFLNETYKLGEKPIYQQAESLSKRFEVETICITLGAKGAKIWHKGRLIEHPGFTVQVVDSIGCGDAFLAVFIAGILQKRSVDESLARACAAGALTAKTPGAIPGYTSNDIGKLINYAS